MSDKPMSEERAVCQEIEKAEAETATLRAENERLKSELAGLQEAVNGLR